MRQPQKTGERRRFRRFRVSGGPFSVLCCDSGEIIGELTDISSGGMAFLSEPDELFMPEYSRIDVLQISDGVLLNGFPVRHVSRISGYFAINRQMMKMARNSLGFRPLAPGQKKELGMFIRNHAGI